MRERRTQPRYEIERAAVACKRWSITRWLLSRFTGQRGRLWAKAKDICDGGVSFITSRPPKRKSSVLLSILLPHEKRPLSAKGIVRWVKHHREQPDLLFSRPDYKAYAVGVSFDPCPRALADALHRQLGNEGSPAAIS